MVSEINIKLYTSTTRQTLDKYSNIKQEYKAKKRSLKGKPVVESDTVLLTYLESDINMANKVIHLESELTIAKEEIGYLQAFISNISNIAQSNPVVMDIFQKTLNDIEANAKK